MPTPVRKSYSNFNSDPSDQYHQFAYAFLLESLLLRNRILQPVAESGFIDFDNRERHRDVIVQIIGD